MFEPLTGQMVLDFEVKALRDDVVRVLRPSAGRERARTAYELYLRASQLDEDPMTMDEAEQLYLARSSSIHGSRLPTRTSATSASAAETPKLRRRSTGRRWTIDRSQPEAQYNLGYVMLERGQPEVASRSSTARSESTPRFADAYFNLAMAYEQVGEASKARPFWRSYIALEPTGTWTEIAKRHL